MPDAQLIEGSENLNAEDLLQTDSRAIPFGASLPHVQFSSGRHGRPFALAPTTSKRPRVVS